MRKMLIGTALVAALAAAPALASGVGSEALRVGDRVGAVKGDGNDYWSFKTTWAIVGFVLVVTTVLVWNEDRDNDDPVSV